MAKIDPTQRELDKLRELNLSDRDAASKTLRLALGSKSSYVVTRAVTLATQAGLAELAPFMVQAYKRQTKDPNCETKTHIMRALIELEAHEEEFFLSERRHRHLEWGIDLAGELRGLCAIGLARCDHRELLEVLVDMMLDKLPLTRQMAVRAAGDSGRPGAVPLLRLKALTVDEPEVVGECL
jgi:hypothetical protein